MLGGDSSSRAVTALSNPQQQHAPTIRSAPSRSSGAPDQANTAPAATTKVMPTMTRRPRCSRNATAAIAAVATTSRFNNSDAVAAGVRVEARRQQQRACEATGDDGDGQTRAAAPQPSHRLGARAQERHHGHGGPDVEQPRQHRRSRVVQQPRRDRHCRAKQHCRDATPHDPATRGDDDQHHRPPARECPPGVLTASHGTQRSPDRRPMAPDRVDARLRGAPTRRHDRGHGDVRHERVRPRRRPPRPCRRLRRRDRNVGTSARTPSTHHAVAAALGHRGARRADPATYRRGRSRVRRANNGDIAPGDAVPVVDRGWGHLRREGRSGTDHRRDREADRPPGDDVGGPVRGQHEAAQPDQPAGQERRRHGDRSGSGAAKHNGRDHDSKGDERAALSAECPDGNDASLSATRRTPRSGRTRPTTCLTTPTTAPAQPSARAGANATNKRWPRHHNTAAASTATTANTGTARTVVTVRAAAMSQSGRCSTKRRRCCGVSARRTVVLGDVLGDSERHDH